MALVHIATEPTKIKQETMDHLSTSNTMRALLQLDKHLEDLILTEVPVAKPSFELNDHLIHVHTVAPCAGELLWPANHPDPDPGMPIQCDDVAVIAPLDSPFKVGDEVYACTSYYRSRCAAEYAIERTEELALKAMNLGWGSNIRNLENRIFYQS